MQRNVRIAGESVQKFCKLDIAKLGSFLLTRHYNFEGKNSYCKNMLNLAQKVANSTPENLPVPGKSRNFACRKGEIPQTAKKPIKYEIMANIKYAHPLEVEKIMDIIGILMDFSDFLQMIINQ